SRMLSEALGTAVTIKSYHVGRALIGDLWLASVTISFGNVIGGDGWPVVAVPKREVVDAFAASIGALGARKWVRSLFHAFSMLGGGETRGLAAFALPPIRRVEPIFTPPPAPARARSSTSRCASPWRRRPHGRRRPRRTGRASACRAMGAWRGCGRACRRRAAG